MKKLICILTLIAAVCVAAAQDVADFAFVTRDGEATTLFAEIAKLTTAPSCPSCSPVENNIVLLLFDPDCDDCHALIGQLKTAPDAPSVIAVFPVDEPLTEDDPNLAAYLRACDELPQEWIVGIDNGSILDGDLYQWDHLPLLIPINPACSPKPPVLQNSCD